MTKGVEIAAAFGLAMTTLIDSSASSFIKTMEDKSLGMTERVEILRCAQNDSEAFQQSSRGS